MAGNAVSVDLWNSKATSSPWQMGATQGAGLVELTSATIAAMGVAGLSNGRRDANGNRLTIANLAGAGTYDSGPISFGGDNAKFGYLNVEINSDQAGVAFVEKSLDTTAWFPCLGTAGAIVAAGATLTVKIPLTTVFYRIRYTNGATPTTLFGIYYNLQLA